VLAVVVTLVEVTPTT